MLGEYREIVVRVFVWVFGVALAIVSILRLFPLADYSLYDYRYFLLYFFIISSFYLLKLEVKRTTKRHSGSN